MATGPSGSPQLAEQSLVTREQTTAPPRKKPHRPVSQATELNWLNTYSWAQPTECVALPVVLHYTCATAGSSAVHRFLTDEGFRRFRCQLCHKYKQVCPG